MKRIFSIFIVALLLATNANAKKDITGEFQPWDENCTISGNTLNFLGEWNGVTFKFYDEENCVYEGGMDLSDYEVIVLKMSDASCMFKIKVEYTDGAQQQDAWGTEAVAQPGVLVVAVPLNSEHKNMVKDFFIQSAKYPGTLTIDKVYACTTAEYEQLLSDNKANSFKLCLKKIDEGGGSSYNTDTQTISIESDGWYFDEEFRNFSAFDCFVIDFQTATTTGEIGVEYDDNTSSQITFEAGTTRAVVPLTTSKDKLRQVYIKGNAGASYTIKDAFFGSNNYMTGVRYANSILRDNNTTGYYTLDGKRQQKAGHGIIIQKTNGKTLKVIR